MEIGLTDLPTVRYATFDIWSKLGYKIIKGSKCFWIEGVSYFNEFQVTENVPPWEKKKLYEKSTIEFGTNSDVDDDIPF